MPIQRHIVSDTMKRKDTQMSVNDFQGIHKGGRIPSQGKFILNYDLQYMHTILLL